MPATQEQIEKLAARARARAPLHQPGDPPLRFQKLDNGRHRVEPVPEKPGEQVYSKEYTFSAPQLRLATLNLPKLKELGQRLRWIRLDRGLSLGAVSVATGISKSALSNIETGRRTRPMLDVLWSLADCYGMSLDKLVGRVA